MSLFDEDEMDCECCGHVGLIFNGDFDVEYPVCGAEYSLIIDEAHHIKNPNTYAYQAEQMFYDNAESIVLLTATPGVGENNKVGRAEISKYLGFLGTEIDDEKNNVRGEDRVISKDGCKVVMLCVPTNEELAIARQTLELVK